MGALLCACAARAHIASTTERGPGDEFLMLKCTM